MLVRPASTAPVDARTTTGAPKPKRRIESATTGTERSLRRGLPANGVRPAMGSQAAAGGVVVAFQGMGDALEAVNKAKLEPTQENLDAAREVWEAASDEHREDAEARP